MKYIVNLILIVVLLSSCSQQTCDTSAFDAGMAKFERNKAIADKTFNLFIAKDLDGMMEFLRVQSYLLSNDPNQTFENGLFLG